MAMPFYGQGKKLSALNSDVCEHHPCRQKILLSEGQITQIYL